MPSAAEILAGLAEIANRGIIVAIAWHAAIAIAAIALLRGWRPTLRTSRLLLALPLVSVSGFAFAADNPFNGIAFAIATVVVGAADSSDRRWRATGGPLAAQAIGIAMIAFGWVYPHFLDVHPAAYAIAAPVGLIPCPTLSVVIGFVMVGGGLGSRRWSIVLAILGLFYAGFGVVRLGVNLDLPLAAGSIALLAIGRAGVPAPARR